MSKFCMVSDPEDSYFLGSHAQQDRIARGLRFPGFILPRDLIRRDPDPPAKSDPGRSQAPTVVLRPLNTFRLSFQFLSMSLKRQSF